MKPKAVILTGIQLAVQACENNQSELARRLKVKPQSIQQWIAANRIPAERVIAVEKATGVSRHLLRPDIYPLDASSSSAA